MVYSLIYIGDMCNYMHMTSHVNVSVDLLNCV